MAILAIAIVTLVWIYRNKKLINEESKKKIETFKRNKKYIENLFLELNDSKECLRYFSQKTLGTQNYRKSLIRGCLQYRCVA